MYQEEVRRRLITASRLLERGGVPYAIIGGNAVAHYVGQISPSAVRSTADVDMVMHRSDLDKAKEALEPNGFRYRYVAGVHMFIDGTKAREGVHVIMAGEKVRPEYASPAPTLDEVVRTEQGYAVIPFPKLVEMKLNSFRDKDRTHLRDMIEVGLLPGDVMPGLPESLRERLQFLLDNPE